MPVPINYLAVIVGAVIQMVLGFLWYGPILGKPWMAIMGISPEAMAQGKNDPKFKRMMMRNYVLLAIGAFLMAWILDHALIFASAYLGISGVGAGLAVGFLNWLGFIAPLSLGPVLWEQKPWKLWFINAGYYLVSMLVVGVLLAVWK